MPTFGMLVAISLALLLSILLTYSSLSSLWIRPATHYQVSILMQLEIGVVTPILKVRLRTLKAKKQDENKLPSTLTPLVNNTQTTEKNFPKESNNNVTVENSNVIQK